MKKEFNKEFQANIFNKYMPFMESVFPEFYGTTNSFTTQELVDLINAYWIEMTKVSGYTDDLRRALQNETVGKILSKEITRRKLPVRAKILTKEGYIEYPPENIIDDD